MGAWSRELDEAQASRSPRPPKHRSSFILNTRGRLQTALRALVKQGGVPYAPNLLQEANRIAMAVWESLDRTQPLYETDNWLAKAVNHPAGSITEFWLESLSLWGKQQDPRPDTLGDEYQVALLKIVEDHTLVGRLGKTLLARHLAFISAVDHGWADARLVPLLKRPDDPDFHAVWNGFLYGGLNPPLADALRSAFLDAVSRMNSMFPNQEWPRQQFVRFVRDHGDFLRRGPPRFLDSQVL